MPKPVDQTIFAPVRSEEHLPDGSVIVTVTPPLFLCLPGKSLRLSPDQYSRYRAWRTGNALIQDCFPDLTSEEREILLNGNPDI